jgi:hypothetical protein
MLGTRDLGPALTLPVQASSPPLQLGGFFFWLCRTRRTVDPAFQADGFSGAAGPTGRKNLAAHRCSNFLCRSRGIALTIRLPGSRSCPGYRLQRSRSPKVPKWRRRNHRRALGDHLSRPGSEGSEAAGTRRLRRRIWPGLTAGPFRGNHVRLNAEQNSSKNLYALLTFEPTLRRFPAPIPAILRRIYIWNFAPAAGGSAGP